jgi:type I restriction enzyme M protein
VKGVAYEEIVGSNLRGDRGEFFTPRNACRMAAAMLDPEPDARILDPACGTGGFLITAMNLVLHKLDRLKRSTWTDEEAPSQAELEEFYRARQALIQRTIYGLDINPNLVRAAKMNMVLNNDGSGGLFQADSLRNPMTWDEVVQERVQLGTFDFVFTNPPFGTNIRIDTEEVLEQYDLAKAWRWDDALRRWVVRKDADEQPILQGSQPPEILFIERCIQFSKPGSGRIAIVVPNGILNNPPLGYVRQWLLENAQVIAVVDMQRDLFQPRNDTQTSMVILRRLSEKEKLKPLDYPIFFAVTTKVGHDKRGNVIYVRDEEGNDVMEEVDVSVQVIENGKLVEKEIRESRPIVDDQLPVIPELFHEWATAHGV